MMRNKRLLAILAFAACVLGLCAQENPSLRERIDSINWVRTGSTLAMRIGMKVAIDATLKHYVHEFRPDRSDRHSFPSRHSSWAYGIGGTIGYELGIYSPFWAIGAQAVANGVGFQRVMTRRHWPGDVLAGAGIGIGTDLFTKAIGNWIWGYDNLYANWYKCRNDFRPALTLSTGASFPLHQDFNGHRLGTALSSTMRCVLPTSDTFGVNASVELQSASIMKDGKCLHPLNGLSITVGASTHRVIADGPFAIAAYAEGGWNGYFSTNDYESKGGVVGKAGIQFLTCLTDKLSLGAEAGYAIKGFGLAAENRALSSISVGLFTKAAF